MKMLERETASMIVEFIGDIITLRNFQSISIDALVSTIETLQKHTHFIYKNIHDYRAFSIEDPRWFYGKASSTGQLDMRLIPLIKSPKSVLFYMPNDSSIYGFRKMREEVVRQWHSVVVIDCPRNKDSVVCSDIGSRKLLNSNKALTTIKFSNMPNCRSLFNETFVLCPNLSKIDLSGLYTVRDLDVSFINQTLKLNVLDLRCLYSLERIHNELGILRDSSYRELLPLHIYLSGMPRLTRLETILRQSTFNRQVIVYMSDLPKLEYMEPVSEMFKFHGMPALREIGNDFLARTITKEVSEIEGLSNLQKVGNRFLSHAILRYIDFIAFNGLRKIGDYFLYNASIAETVDLGPLVNLETIGNSALYAFKSEVPLEIRNLPKLHSIGSSFANSSMITSITLENLPSLLTIELGFFKTTDKLTTAIFRNLPNLKSIDRPFLHSSPHLYKLEFIGLTSLEKIPDAFMSENVELCELSLCDMPSLTHIGNFVLTNTMKLRKLNIQGIPNLQHIGLSFMTFASNELEIKFDECDNPKHPLLAKFTEIGFAGTIVPTQLKI
jgi:hypothetical protein